MFQQHLRIMCSIGVEGQAVARSFWLVQLSVRYAIQFRLIRNKSNEFRDSKMLSHFQWFWNVGNCVQIFLVQYYIENYFNLSLLILLRFDFRHVRLCNMCFWVGSFPPFSCLFLSLSLFCFLVEVSLNNLCLFCTFKNHYTKFCVWVNIFFVFTVRCWFSSFSFKFMLILVLVFVFVSIIYTYFFWPIWILLFFFGYLKSVSTWFLFYFVEISKCVHLYVCKMEN